MSKQSALQFLEKIEKDAKFRDKILKAKNLEERKKITEEANLRFTQKEYTEALNEKYQTTLNEEEMKKISAAGGQKLPQSVLSIDGRPSYSYSS